MRLAFCEDPSYVVEDAVDPRRQKGGEDFLLVSYGATDGTPDNVTGNFAPEVIAAEQL